MFPVIYKSFKCRLTVVYTLCVFGISKLRIHTRTYKHTIHRHTHTDTHTHTHTHTHTCRHTKHTHRPHFSIRHKNTNCYITIVYFHNSFIVIDMLIHPIHYFMITRRHFTKLKQFSYRHIFHSCFTKWRHSSRDYSVSLSHCYVIAQSTFQLHSVKVIDLSEVKKQPPPPPQLKTKNKQ